MSTPPIDVYLAAFVARCNAVQGPECQLVNEPGVHGLLSRSDDAPTRLLVTGDEAADVLAALMPDARAGTISVFAAAPRCTGIMTSHAGWRPKAVTAMINRDLRSVPEDPLPRGLTLRSVRRTAADPTDGVPLKDAVAAATAADLSSENALDGLFDHLSSLPATTRLFAAVDDDGVVRATSGVGTFGAQATVFFVNTHPTWRSRGIGQAMTAAALRTARNAGAAQACLDASDAAIAIYARLGFERVARTTQFFRAG